MTPWRTAQCPAGARRQRPRPRSSHAAPRPSRSATASAAPGAARLRERVAWRTCGGAAAAVAWTSGLAPAGSAVTSLIRRPDTSGPEGAGPVVRLGRRGARCRAAGAGGVVVAGGEAAEEVLVVDWVAVVVDGVVAEWDGADGAPPEFCPEPPEPFAPP